MTGIRVYGYLGIRFLFFLMIYRFIEPNKLEHPNYCNIEDAKLWKIVTWDTILGQFPPVSTMPLLPYTDKHGLRGRGRVSGQLMDADPLFDIDTKSSQLEEFCKYCVTAWRGQIIEGQESEGVWGRSPRNIFEGRPNTLSENASPKIMLAISDKETLIMLW